MPSVGLGIALVPLPLLPPVLVVNDPKGSISNESPAALWPLTAQKMLLLAGNEGTGVQVSTLLLALQEDVVGMGAVGLNKSMNVASVKSGSISMLKVKTTVVVVGTPIAPSAGTTETRAGCARACQEQASETAKVSNAAKCLRRGNFHENIAHS